LLLSDRVDLGAAAPGLAGLWISEHTWIFLLLSDRPARHLDFLAVIRLTAYRSRRSGDIGSLGQDRGVGNHMIM
jgi:hypothetical protein